MTGVRTQFFRMTVPGMLIVATTFASPPAPGERETPTDTPRSTQRVDQTPPPTVPTDTPVDPGTPLPPLPPIQPPGFSLKRVVTDAASAKSPGQFNPDPGAAFRPIASPEESYFKTNRIEFQSPELAPVPAGLALPRGPLEQVSIVLAPPASPPTYGLDSLLGNEKLPRAGTRENLYITTDWHAPKSYASVASGEGIPLDAKPVPDRWRGPGFTPWRRYTSGDTNEMSYADTQPDLWHYYRQSLLKGDLPVYGQDVFLSLTASSELLYEDRKLTVPSGVSASNPGSADFFGKSRSTLFDANLAIEAVLFQGETVFKPVEWAVKIKPVFNFNQVDFKETGIVSPNPGGSGAGGGSPGNGGVNNPGDVGGLLGGGLSSSGSLDNSTATNRNRTYVALQEAFVEVHLKNLSANYDFVAVKVGNQTFNSDFRGFVFNDTNLGVRLFGNYDDNRYQYNFALFDMREKDTNSELNTFDSRGQRVFIANLYRQDFLWHGYTAEWSFLGNFDDGGTHYDANGAIVRPAPLGTVVAHKVKSAYFGWAGDGHIGRWNVSHAAYLAVGHDDFNGLAGRPVDIFAQMAALEISYDRDWIRYKASIFYASGDNNPTNGKATGFDSIVDNTNFEGGPFSYFVRQGFNLAGTSVDVKQRFSLLPNLRTSKTEGQSNFVNPGLVMIGVGADIDVTPKVKAFLSANSIRFATTEPLKTALFTNEVSNDFGIDLGLGLQWRPLLKDNIIVSLGYGVLLPGRGFRDIYRTTQPPVPGYTSAGPQIDSWLYSAVAAVTLTY